MHYIIIILLIIIILILVAPTVLGIIGLLIAGIIGAIINYWWVFVIAIVLALALPSILKIGLNSIENSAKFSNKKKYIIFSTSTILLLAIVLGILLNNKIILTYPIKVDDNDIELRMRADEKLFNDRGDKLNDIIPFGKFRFGMTKNEVLDYVKKNNISTEIFFDIFTYSNITISDSTYELPVKYYFDTNNKLRAVEFKIDTILIKQIKKLFGNKYVEVALFGDKTMTTWFKGNQEITLFENSYGKKINIQFKDNNYNGILNSTPIYSPTQKLIENELIKQKSGLKEKKNTFLGFQLGMTSKEVDVRKKELYLELIENDNFIEGLANKEFITLKDFKFWVDEKDWVHIRDIMFSFEDDKLYELVVFIIPDNESINNKFLEMYLKKYGGYNFKMMNEYSNMMRFENSNIQYLWIKDGVEITYSSGEIIYVDIKIRYEKIQQEAIIKKKNEIEKMKIIELEKEANKEKKLKLKNQKNNI